MSPLFFAGRALGQVGQAARRPRSAQTRWPLLASIIGAAVSCSSGTLAVAPGPPTVAPTTPETSASPLPRVTPTHASRSRLTPADHRTPRSASTPTRGTATGSLLDVTGYCWTGHRAADGTWPRIGTAAGNRWPFGTRLRVPGIGVVTITDRIGHGSDLDIYIGRAGCDQRARTFGRKHLTVEVIR